MGGGGGDERVPNLSMQSARCAMRGAENGHVSTENRDFARGWKAIGGAGRGTVLREASGLHGDGVPALEYVKQIICQETPSSSRIPPPPPLPQLPPPPSLKAQLVRPPVVRLSCGDLLFARKCMCQKNLAEIFVSMSMMRATNSFGLTWSKFCKKSHLTKN